VPGRSRIDDELAQLTWGAKRGYVTHEEYDQRADELCLQADAWAAIRRRNRRGLSPDQLAEYSRRWAAYEANAATRRRRR